MVSLREETALDQLDRELARSLQAARKRADPVLVSAAVPIRILDPLTMFAAARDNDRAFWEQPDRRFAWIAIGSAARVEASGDARFEDVSASWQRLARTAITSSAGSCPIALPIAVGGFAFQPAARGGAWAAYPDALLVAPRLLFVTDQDSSWLIATVLADSDGRSDDPGRIISEAERLLSGSGTGSLRAQPSGTLTHPDGNDADTWKAAVADVLREIKGGEIRKLVLARRIAVRAGDAIDTVAPLERLRSRYRACTTFAVQQGDSCFLGATPERLVRLDGRTVRVDCLAGSAPRGAGENEDAGFAAALAADTKERHEHALVVDSIRNALAPLAETLNIPLEPGIMQMPNVQHLHTPIAGTLRGDTSVIDLAARLHPTPAAGGVPREAADELIRKYEPFHRGWYAGPVGWVDAAGGGEFVVAIRSALLREREALLYAGCGIVAGSDPGREFEESRLKLEPMRWAINGADS